MSAADNGGAAFPKAGLDPWGKVVDVHTGMTLRDYFAAAALPGLIGGRAWGDKDANAIISEWATAAYLVADRMLLERAA